MKIEQETADIYSSMIHGVRYSAGKSNSTSKPQQKKLELDGKHARERVDNL